MDVIATVTGIAAVRRSNAEEGPGDAGRFRAQAATAPGEAPIRADRHEAARDPPAPPSPDTVVTTSPRHTAAAEERARAREAALRVEHAAEVARLAAALRDQKQAHAAEIERLRAGHAAGLRRLVEAHWRALDAARTAAEPLSGGPGEGAAPESQTPYAVRPPGTRGRLARIMGKGGEHPLEPSGRLAAEPFAADVPAAVRALRPAGAAALSRLRSMVRSSP